MEWGAPKASPPLFDGAGDFFEKGVKAAHFVQGAGEGEFSSDAIILLTVT
jgi:hypothetical protein